MGFIELLEDRRLLSITWVNRGKADAFDRIYKADAVIARQLVDSAIADWNKALPGANAKVKISAANLDAGKKVHNTLGVTTRTTIRLDVDGAKQGWYFDHDLDDDSDITHQGLVTFLHAGFNPSSTAVDFYTAVAHELGHALGFADRQTPYTRHAGKRKLVDIHHASDGEDLMYPFEGYGSRRLISEYDILHTTAGKKMATATAPRTFFNPRASTGAPVLRLTWGLRHGEGTVSIYRSTSPVADASEATLLKVTASGERGFIDATAVPGVTYYYLLVPTDHPEYAGVTSGSRTGGPVSAVHATDGQNGIHLTWDQMPGGFSAEVFRSTVNLGTVAASGAVGIVGVTTAGDAARAYWDDQFVAPGTTYYYWVQWEVDDGSGSGQMESTEPAMVTHNAGALGAVRAEIREGQIWVEWDSLPGTQGHDLYRTTTPTPPPPGSHPLGSSWSGVFDGTAQVGEGYYYWVVTQFGWSGSGIETPYTYPVSNRIYQTTNSHMRQVIAGTTTEGTAVRIAPVLSYPNVGNDVVDHYDVYRSMTNVGGDRIASGAQVISTINARIGDDFLERYLDFDLPPATDAYYWLVAVYKPFDDVTFTRESEMATGRRVASTWLDGAPSAGTVRAGMFEAQDVATVKWDAVAGSGGYDIYVADAPYWNLNPARPANPIAHLSDPAATQWTLNADASHYAGSQYRFWVVATPGAGLVSDLALGSDIGAIGNVSATQGNSGGVTVNFTSSTGQYIFRSTVNAGSPAGSGLTLLAYDGSGYVDSTAVPGVTYYYWIFDDQLQPHLGVGTGRRT